MGDVLWSVLICWYPICAVPKPRLLFGGATFSAVVDGDFVLGVRGGGIGLLRTKEPPALLARTCLRFGV